MTETRQETTRERRTRWKQSQPYDPELPGKSFVNSGEKQNARSPKRNQYVRFPILVLPSKLFFRKRDDPHSEHRFRPFESTEDGRISRRAQRTSGPDLVR